MPDSNEVVTDPRLEKRTRRRFSVTEKKRLLAEAEGLLDGQNGVCFVGTGCLPESAYTQSKP